MVSCLLNNDGRLNRLSAVDQSVRAQYTKTAPLFIDSFTLQEMVKQYEYEVGS